MNNITVSRIPIPSEILKGNWSGVVYAIYTVSLSLDIHKATANNHVTKIVKEFEDGEHYTVSLIEVKRELVFFNNNLEQYCTLVQFRVRDVG
jgi:hypothetical protein